MVLENQSYLNSTFNQSSFSCMWKHKIQYLNKLKIAYFGETGISEKMEVEKSLEE